MRETIIDWIHGARAKGVKQGLNNMHALLERLDHPEKAFKSVHVAGTNGKGSTCAFIERALRESGYKTGLYTSPYLLKYEERVRVGGEPITEEALVRIGHRLMDAFSALTEMNIYPTTFELGTALAFCYFAECAVDIAVIEVGMGGRLDPTNVISPEVCAIATIGLDHTATLGETLPLIAREKAGIIKSGVPAALYPQPPEVDEVIASIAESRGAPLFRMSPGVATWADAYGSGFQWMGETYEIRLPGAFQVMNASLALTALHLLKDLGFDLPADAVKRGLYRAQWPGRLQWIGEKILIDGAHNPEGAGELVAYLCRYFPGQKPVLLTGMMGDKDVSACAAILAPAFSRIVTTRIDWPKAMDATALADVYTALGAAAEPVPDLEAAISRAIALSEGTFLVIAGSLYLAGGALFCITL